ncbi:MAG: recombinase [Thioalkalivibrionaceae bacterium]
MEDQSRLGAGRRIADPNRPMVPAAWRRDQTWSQVPAAVWLAEAVALLEHPSAREGAAEHERLDAISPPLRLLAALFDWLRAGAQGVAKGRAGPRAAGGSSSRSARAGRARSEMRVADGPEGSISVVRRRLEEMRLTLESSPMAARRVAAALREALGQLHWLRLLATAGLNERRGLWADLAARSYDRFSPAPIDEADAFSLLRLWLMGREDLAWMTRLSDDEWLRFFSTLLRLDDPDPEERASVARFYRELRSEALYALEMVGVWLAAEELDPALLRVDPAMRERDSAFVALARETAVTAERLRAGETLREEDRRHREVLLEQAGRQIERLKKRSVNAGSTLNLKHLLDRLGQTLARTQVLFELVDPPDYEAQRRALGTLMRDILRAHAERNSLRAPFARNLTLLARSVTENASDHGEHYVARDVAGHFAMFRAAAGAGAVIALMALNKIYFESLGLGEGVTTVLASLNYGLGFVLIHILHWTVATKQPAMTAAYIAEVAEQRDARGRIDCDAIVRLIIDVVRTQMAAIAGNVVLAVSVALALSAAVLTVFGGPLIDAATGEYLLDALRPIAGGALFYAAIAGVWLFVAGLIAGYFDNRARLIDLEGRVRVHPWLTGWMPADRRARLGHYLGENYGALAGNFFFGVLLGVTGYVGYLLGVPLDIRHVAFASANVGYAVLPVGLAPVEFAMFVGFALMIGLVNLTVSFLLALSVALRARGVRLGSPLRLIAALARAIVRRPLALLWPPGSTDSRRGADSR